MATHRPCIPPLVQFLTGADGAPSNVIKVTPARRRPKAYIMIFANFVYDRHAAQLNCLHVANV